MAIKNILLITFAFWFFFGSSNVIAKSHKNGDHQHHHDAIASPFDSKQKVQSLHCLLRGHADWLVCPHSNAYSDQIPSIAKECDGKNSGSVPTSISLASEFAETSIIVQIHYSSGAKLFQTVLPSFKNFIDSLDPPPILAI
jgi:hypothetical protein